MCLRVYLTMIDLFLLISDTTVEDSLQVALKKFARADFLLYQNKKKESLEQFQLLLKEHKGEDIGAITLLRIGKIYEKQGDFIKALENYNSIITTYKESIYIDEALYFSAEIYNNQLKEIQENGIMQWINDRRDMETLKEKKAKTISRTRKEYPNHHDYYEY